MTVITPQILDRYRAACRLHHAGVPDDLTTARGTPVPRLPRRGIDVDENRRPHHVA
jgi:hypothetical protein